MMLDLLDEMPLYIAVIGALTLGLAPFVPEPHIWEKFRMLRAGSLRRPLDWFDLALHTAPFLLLVTKLMRMAVS